MELHENINEVIVQPADKAKIRQIWKVAGILAIITAIEFTLAYVMPAGSLRISIFIALTLVKAFYIVAEFMHLGHEQKTLIYTIIMPLILVLWLVGVLITEGAAILLVR